MTSGRAPVNKRGLTQKQESFCLNYFQCGNATASAVLAKYSPKTAHSIATQNLQKVAVIARIAELRKRAEDASVMGVLERKQRLSEIARANLVDFQDPDGRPALTKDIPHHAAASEYLQTTTYTKSGDMVVKRVIRLRSPVEAINELNKMDGSHAPTKVANPDGSPLKPPQTLIVNVVSPQGADMVKQIVAGCGTERPALGPPPEEATTE